MRTAAKSGPPAPPTPLVASKSGPTAPSTPLVKEQLLRDTMHVACVKAEALGVAEVALSEAPSLPSSGLSDTASLPGSDAASLPASATEWVQLFIKDNKKDYNKFNYRLRLNSEEVKKEWKRIQQQGTSADAQQFVKQIASGKRTTISSAEAFEDSTAKRTQKGWKPWKFVADIEGDAQLRAMVKAGTLDTRRHPKIPESADLEWPDYLQVEYEVETEDTTHKHSNTSVRNTRFDSDDSEGEREISAHSLAIQAPHLPQAVCVPNTPNKSELPPASENDLKAARKSCTTAHTAWDKNDRDSKVVLELSKANRNTQGCHLEVQLNQSLLDGAVLDAGILNSELRFSNKDVVPPPTSKDIDDAASTAQKIADMVKDGKKKRNALKTLMGA